MTCSSSGLNSGRKKNRRANGIVRLIASIARAARLGPGGTNASTGANSVCRGGAKPQLPEGVIPSCWPDKRLPGIGPVIIGTGGTTGRADRSWEGSAIECIATAAPAEKTTTTTATAGMIISLTRISELVDLWNCKKLAVTNYQRQMLNLEHLIIGSGI